MIKKQKTEKVNLNENFEAPLEGTVKDGKGPSEKKIRELKLIQASIDYYNFDEVCEFLSKDIK